MLASRPRIAENVPPWLRLLRPHHWAKNLLLFAPALTSSLILEPDILAKSVLGFVSFCCAASTGYVMNDLADLSSDRDHLQKRYRPIAAGDIQVVAAIPIGLTCLSLAITTAITLNTQFSLLVFSYLLLTAFYSLFIKQFVYADVVALVGLYLIRIAAGAAAIGVIASAWLLWSAAALFLSLACMKRYAELLTLRKTGAKRVVGRAYMIHHLPSICAIGVSAGLTSIVIFGLYLQDPAALEIYGSQAALWSVLILFGCWITGLWISTHKGRMTYDPIVFVFSNFWSLLILLAMIILTLWTQISASL